jgi:hypothetical protein
MEFWKLLENIQNSVKECLLGYYEWKLHKLQFDEGCTELLDQRKQATLQWLQDPNEINENSLNTVRHKASNHFQNNSSTPATR